MNLPPLKIVFNGSHEHGRALGRVVEDFYYTVGGVTDYIPAGFQTDFESVPWWAQWLVPRAGRSLRAAVIHDYLISVSGYSFKANHVMTEVLKVEGVPAWRRAIIGFALDIFTLWKRVFFYTPGLDKIP